MKKFFGWMLCACLLGCCCWTHRRVITACVKGEPMPEAPWWHFWCSNRKSR